MNFISTILSDEHNEELIQYTIRTYSRIFNSSPIQQEVLINGEYKTLIKPYIWHDKMKLMKKLMMDYLLTIVVKQYYMTGIIQILLKKSFLFLLIIYHSISIRVIKQI